MSRPAQVPFVQQIATLRATVAELRAKNVKLRAALMAVTPGCRATGACWCEWSRNLKQFGHSYACVEARAALRGGGK